MDFGSFMGLALLAVAFGLIAFGSTVDCLNLRAKRAERNERRIFEQIQDDAMRALKAEKIYQISADENALWRGGQWSADDMERIMRARETGRPWRR